MSSQSFEDFHAANGGRTRLAINSDAYPMSGKLGERLRKRGHNVNEVTIASMPIEFEIARVIEWGSKVRRWW